MTIASLAKTYISRPTIRIARALRKRAQIAFTRHWCSVCDRPVDKFIELPTWYFDQWKAHGFKQVSSTDETCNFEAYSCPHCNASDRDRLYALFLREELPAVASDRKFALIDFAPSASLANHIKHTYTITYRSADLFMEDVDDHVDMRSMDIYPTATFDAFICSHVLEHIPEDTKAMRELYRILKPGGWGIAMVPIPFGTDLMREDTSIETEAERWRHFGQGDHVRIYSRREFVRRLNNAGFNVRALDQQHFSAKAFALHGLASTSTLYIAIKPRPTSQYNKAN